MTAKKQKSTAASKQVMDIAKPGTLKTAAAASARPVIVTNRVVIQDPMVKAEGDKAAKADTQETPATESVTPTRTKVVIRPLSDPPAAEEKPADDKPADDKPADDAEKTEAKKEGLLDIPLDPSLTGELDADDADAEETADKEAAAETKSEEPAEPAEDTSKKDEPEEPAETEETKPEESETPEESNTSPETPAGDDAPVNPDKKAAAAEAAIAKEQEELDNLIENKEYFLPIDSVEKRRTRVVAVVGVLVILLLAAAWVNVSLDAGFIEIPGVQPVTHFFNAK